MAISAYMLVALIAASGSCQQPQIIVQSMPSLESCRAAMNFATNIGGRADCVSTPTPSPNARESHAVGYRWQEKRSRRSTGSEEVERLNRAQLGH